jgi:hypothetical protein
VTYGPQKKENCVDQKTKDFLKRNHVWT